MDVFVILTHVSKHEHNQIWQRCVESVKKYHPEAKIVIIADKCFIEADVQVIVSEFPGAGEILPYYYFAKFQWAKRMIVLHDSMFLQKRIEFDNSHINFFGIFGNLEVKICKMLNIIYQF